METNKEIEPGDYIKLKGREPEGTVRRVSHAGWVSVDWNPGKLKGPRFVHLNEIEIQANEQTREG